jgi:pyrroline-5-carboxylate reductase
MGSALVGGIVESGVVAAQDIHAFDAYLPAVEQLVEARGVVAAESAEAAVEAAEAVLVCVKPADVASLGGLLEAVASSKLVISIAAGVRLSTLAEHFGDRHRLLRVMPNTPALLGAGVAGIAPGSTATPEDLGFAHRVFASVGRVMEVPERLMDAVTGLSGSGPAYVYTVIEALADGGVLMGLPREMALEAAAQTVLGAARMVQDTGMHPGQLRDQVTSPGGTTAAGLEALEQGGLRVALLAAVRAATERSAELGKE